MNVEYQPFRTEHPEFGTEPVPSMPYVSPQYFELEREHIFKKSWLIMGRLSEIPNVGDYVVKDIEIANLSVLIVRGRDGTVKAFHNVCSHRASKLVWESSGHASVFTCPYHAWSYGLEGQLRGVTGPQKFYDLVKEDCGLTPIALEVWQGFMFINLEPQPAQGLHESLGSLATYAEGFPFEDDGGSMKLEFPELRCNWKVALDAFQESYHLGFLHKQTLSGIFTSGDRPLGDPITIKIHGRHRTISMWVNTAHKVGPVEGLAQRFVSNINSTAGGAAANAKEKLRMRAPGINPMRDPNWGVDANVIFPNTQFLALAGSYQFFQFWPLTVDTCRMSMTVYYAKPAKASERFARESGFAHTKGVVMEDVYNCENTQRAHKSRGKKYLTLQDGEGAIRHNLYVLEQILGPYLTDEIRAF